MHVQSKLVIIEAQPILGQLIKENYFHFYVQHWLVSGYHWDGECLCSAVYFKNEKINIHDLQLSKKLIRQQLEAKIN